MTARALSARASSSMDDKPEGRCHAASHGVSHIQAVLQNAIILGDFEHRTDA